MPRSRTLPSIMHVCPFIAPKPDFGFIVFPRGLLYSPPRHPSKHLPFAAFKSVTLHLFSNRVRGYLVAFFLSMLGSKHHTSNRNQNQRPVDHFRSRCCVCSFITNGGRSSPAWGHLSRPHMSDKGGYPFVRCFFFFFHVNHVNIPRQASMLGLIFPNRKIHTSQSLCPSKQAEFDSLALILWL